jgi:hypothetical protein
VRITIGTFARRLGGDEHLRALAQPGHAG